MAQKWIRGVALNSAVIPTPQISPNTKQICLGDLRCGISVIHFALYYTAH